jgi:putative membrane-bound dehydrogenase-like protein
MKNWLLLAFFGFLLLAPVAARAQVPPEKAEATFTVADGLEMKLWASEPLFVNPTCIDIDHKGRVWVCESVNYRHKLHGQKPRRPEGDRILILEDSLGTGKADKVTTFYQAPEILAPMGIAVAKDPVGPGYKVYVCQSPDILLFEDKDGDGKADGPPKKLLSGFRGIDHDHGVHGILIGPDGKLYFSVGDQGVDGLQSSDGKGRKWTTNHTDCQAGTIWRCDLDGKNLELIAHNFRNEYEPCVDSFGNIFVSDNDDDGNQQTRICFVMPGGNYGYWPRGPGESHWHEEQPGVVPKILRTYFGSPTGMCVYEGTLLPKKYWGQLLHTDAGPRHVRCYHLKPDGAGYAVDREDMVTSTDNWFRPSDICVAPDGSVFVADWYDPGVGGHGMGDTTRGRIYRLAPKGNKSRVPTVDLTAGEGIVAALNSPALSVRYMAIQKVRSLSVNECYKLLDCARTPSWDDQRMARLLWLLPISSPDYYLIDAAMDSPYRKGAKYTLRNDKFLCQCVRQLVARYPDLAKAPEMVRKQLREEVTRASVVVRREILLALRTTSPEFAREIILPLASKYDGHDRFYLEAIGIAVGHHDNKRREIILADFDKYFHEWNDKVAKLVWELRPPVMMKRMEKLLTDNKLPPAQRVSIVVALATSGDQEAGKALLKLLPTDAPKEVRDRAVENLKQFLPNKWHELRTSPELSETIDQLLSQSRNRPYALALIVAGQRNDDRAVDAVSHTAQEPANEMPLRKEAVLALGSLPSAKAVQLIVPFLNDGLAFEAIQSLGEHAHKPNGPGSAAALQVLKQLVLDTYPEASHWTLSEPQKQELRTRAAVALAGGRPGTIWLLNLHAKKKLPAALMPDLARLLRNSPYQDLQNRALAAFPPPGKLDPKRLPSIAVLAARRGNPDRGKELLAASVKSDIQCLKCHTIRGVGGNVGPDLSVIGAKASRENLIESILLPSKAIADQYVTWMIATKKGLVVSGLLVQETDDHVTLRDANAKDTRVEKTDIESRTKSPNSIMPNDLLAYMTDDDLVDIVEYLFSLKTAGPEREK